MPYERDPRQTAQIAGLVATAAVITNIAFYFLSGLYYEDRTAMYGAVTDEHIQGVRIAFAVFTGAVGAGAVLATVNPLLVGLGIAGVTAIGALVAGVAAAAAGMTPVLPASLLVGGVVLVLLVWKTAEKVRSAWAFLIGMCSVLAAVLLFGATKVRNTLDVGLYTALIIPGLLTVATFALATIRNDYREA